MDRWSVESSMKPQQHKHSYQILMEYLMMRGISSSHKAKLIMLKIIEIIQSMFSNCNEFKLGMIRKDNREIYKHS